MGYYAHGSGEIRLKRPIPEEVIGSFEGFDSVDQYERDNKGIKQTYVFLQHYDDKYHEDCVYHDLAKIEPYAIEGSVDFMGEDECIWRFRFDSGTGEFIEEGGQLIYDYDDSTTAKRMNGNKLEFLNSIIEVFETFLDEKGIIIDNPDKAQDPNASNIYGCDYGDLESELEHALKGWGVMA